MSHSKLKAQYKTDTKKNTGRLSTEQTKSNAQSANIPKHTHVKHEPKEQRFKDSNDVHTTSRMKTKSKIIIIIIIIIWFI